MVRQRMLNCRSEVDATEGAEVGTAGLVTVISAMLGDWGVVDVRVAHGGLEER